MESFIFCAERNIKKLLMPVQIYDYSSLYFGGSWNRKQTEMTKTKKQAETERLASNMRYVKSLYAV